MAKLKKFKISSIVSYVRKYISEIEDIRREPKYKQEEIVLSVFAMMFLQEPSLLKFKERFEIKQKKENIERIFGIKELASDNQIRNILDKIPSEKLKELYKEIFRRLQRSKIHEKFKYIDGNYYLVPIDGTEYFSSNEIHCNHCLETKHSDGTITYSHKVLQGAIVDPMSNYIIPFEPEEIRNEDGFIKQDCEINAAKRYMKRIRESHPKLKLVLLGDGLYSNGPIIEEAKKHKLSFIFVATETRNKSMFELLKDETEEFEEKIKEEQKTIKAKGHPKRTEVHHYRWYNKLVSISENSKQLVKFFEFTIYDKDTKKELFHNTWVTDLDITKDNIERLVASGRGRWKIENNQFLTTKKGGYELEHNYGHGSENLSFNFYLLNVFAFLVHQVLHLTYENFNKMKKKSGTFSEMYDFIRQIIKVIKFNSFEDIVEFFLNTC